MRTPWTAQGRRALSYKCAHHPACCPTGAIAIAGGKYNCAGSPHTFPIIIPMMLYTPLRDCTPPPTSQSGPALPSLGHHHQAQLCRFTRHQLTHTPWSAQGCRALPWECAHHPVSQCGPALLLASRATKDIFNKLKFFWLTVSGEPSAVKHALSTHHLMKSLSRQGTSSTWSIRNKQCSTDQNTDAHCKHRILKGQTCPVSTAMSQFHSASNIKMIKATEAVTNVLCKLTVILHTHQNTIMVLSNLNTNHHHLFFFSFLFSPFSFFFGGGGGGCFFFVLFFLPLFSSFFFLPFFSLLFFLFFFFLFFFLLTSSGWWSLSTN